MARVTTESCCDREEGEKTDGWGFNCAYVRRHGVMGTLKISGCWMEGPCACAAREWLTALRQ